MMYFFKIKHYFNIKNLCIFLIGFFAFSYKNNNLLTKDTKFFEKNNLNQYAINWLHDPHGKHNIYISLTTSPKRISQLHKVIETIDLENVKQVLVHLPERFSRDDSVYCVPEELRFGFNKKVHIVRIPVDFGPITKLVSAVDYLKNEQNEMESLIITVDDDTAYPLGMVHSILNEISVQKNTVFASVTSNLMFWKIFSNHFPGSLNVENEDSGDFDLVEGFSGVGYIAKDVDSDLMKLLSNKDFSKHCFVSDDLVISFVLGLSGIKKKIINKEYFNRFLIHQFDYGFEEDALHRGAGLDAHEQKKNMTSKKYQKCYDDLMKVAYDPIKKVFQSRDNIFKNVLSITKK